MTPENVKSLPESIRYNQELIQEAIQLGCTKTISMAHWMKLHCQYGCSQYGALLTCPPYSPSTDEMTEILGNYDKALLINADPKANVRDIVVELEQHLREKGFSKAFALCSQPCDLCAPCTVTTVCQFPEKARPTLQSCGIDVNETIHNNGWEDLGPQKPCTPNHAIGMVLLG